MPDQEITIPERLYTWVDVDAHLEALAANKRWPRWLHECDAFWDGLEMTIAPGEPPEHALDWLSENFGFGSIVAHEGGSALQLDDVPGRSSTRLLPIRISHREPDTPRREPRWRERRIIQALGQPLPPPQSAFSGNVRIAALHSFKGGVGRTLHGVALADALAQRGERVLLVDADLEAPGITWMFAAQGRRVDFSYEDFLALLHSSEDGRPHDAVTLGAAYLPNQALDGVIVMPARRSLLNIAPPRLEPTDLLTPDRSMYYLTESLAELAHQLGVRTVLIDLRAGSSELAAPVLLDPRVQRVFVTTVSNQSLYGTIRTIRELGRRAPSRADDPASVAVITQFREQGHRELALEAAAQLRNVIAETLEPRLQDGEDRTVDSDLMLEPIFSVFQDRLLALPPSWEEVITLVRRQQLAEALSPLVDELIPPRELAFAEEAHATESLLGTAENDLPSLREALSDFAQRLAYAETANDTAFLPTESLRNLLISHRTEPPLCVVAGAKGSGKTFTQIQMCFRRTWKDYARDVGVENVTLDAPLAPVLVSKNLITSTVDRIHEIQSNASVSPEAEPASQLKLRDLITEALRSQLSDLQWRRIWLTCMAQAVGIDASPDDVEEKLADFARVNSRIFLIDGLEDLLQDFSRDDAQRRALRVLLVDTLDWLRSLRGRPLGLVIFVRRDLVQAAIRQNYGQFFARYSEYELKWNPTEALRLALWVAQRSGALPGLSSEEVASAKDQALSNLLLPLWGEKMGSPRSREARSEGWFLAALSDFNGQIQARDIVTFLKESAALSVPDHRWTDRLLVPAAMRKALVQCSKAKIEAISAESPRVGDLLKRLDSLPAEHKRIPFSPETVELSNEELEILSANGVVFREEDQYWIPEIFRHGLSFKATGRPKILAIANLVRQRNNLD
ncbi:MinD-like ATPase involved in chromosome partitioning or flagellar assembly [Thermostaphylospora chromogena]|uniref:MinD-like ATPase involved in chromosome partitioning or flagellar assembly n=2 Tax=Thermostaphylospora chromogena TaxID=35622 RepID=A0A1H1CVU6_9ACTN|nr:MinD-like ATPase involved in chromosome partitioning or flagellar assembly [Thermostaphylospora chromogena]